MTPSPSTPASSFGAPLAAQRNLWLAWAAIAVAAAAIRLIGLDGSPAGLFRDEAEKGYNAYSLAVSGGVIETPIDPDRGLELRWRRWPYVIDVMGAKTSAIYQYASIPFVKLFGLSVGSTRMAAAMAGSLTVALLGALLLWVWPPGAALGAMAWLALCPWHYIFSRWAAQGIFVPLGMTATLLGLIGVQRRRPWGFPLAGAALGLCFYAYSGAQPFVLLWGAGLFFVYRGYAADQKRSLIAGLAVFLALAAPRAMIVAFGGGAGRLDAVAVWNAEDATFLNTAGRIVANYLSHFSPLFLFAGGDSLPRHGINGWWGQLLAVDVLFLPIGLWVSFRRKAPLAEALALAFIFGPVGAAITREGIPHALRSLPMVIPAAVWGGLGLVTTAQWIARGGGFSRAAGAARPKSSRAYRTVLAGVALGACFVYAAAVLAVYWGKHRSDPETRRAFAADERQAFENLLEKRKPDQRVFVSAFVGNGYAPYFILFHVAPPPRETARGGLEALGFSLFDPRRSTPEQRFNQLAPGEWIVALDEDRVTLTQREEP